MKRKHVEQLGVICSHGREVISTCRQAQDRAIRLGKAVLNFHFDTEKEEQKRIERTSEERLKALKTDDEEAYMKLIDTAKDTRITHLIRQTDTCLNSLAQAVMAQQNEQGGLEYELEDGPTNEYEEAPEDKGKVDYYAVAHRMSEKVTKQHSLRSRQKATSFILRWYEKTPASWRHTSKKWLAAIPFPLSTLRRRSQAMDCRQIATWN